MNKYFKIFLHLFGGIILYTNLHDMQTIFSISIKKNIVLSGSVPTLQYMEYLLLLLVHINKKFMIFGFCLVVSQQILE